MDTVPAVRQTNLISKQKRGTECSVKPRGYLRDLTRFSVGPEPGISDNSGDQRTEPHLEPPTYNMTETLLDVA